MIPEEIAALVDQKVAERTASLQQELDRVKSNRDQVIAEKRKLVADKKSDVEIEHERVMRAADKLLAPKTGAENFHTDRVVIPRHASAQEYQRLKASAQERGVPYVVEDSDVDPALSGFARATDSKVKVVETDATYYANQALQRSLGVVELSRRAAEKGKTLRIFRGADDLANDPEAVQKHQRILEAGDPETLVFGG